MKPELLIDGYNVIKKLVQLQAREMISLEAARNELIKMLAVYKALHPGLEIVIVFDAAGAEGPGSVQVQNSGIKVVFDRASADARIKKIVETNHNPRGITVVSEDRGISVYVKGLGAKILSPSELWQRLKTPVSRQGAETDKPLLSSAQTLEIDEELRQIWEIDDMEDAGDD